MRAAPESMKIHFNVKLLDDVQFLKMSLHNFIFFYQWMVNFMHFQTFNMTTCVTKAFEKLTILEFYTQKNSQGTCSIRSGNVIDKNL